MTRKLLPDEMLFRGNPAGRPKTAVQKKPRTIRRPAEPTSRCARVSQVEAHAAKMNPKQKRMEGIHATVDMKSREVLHVFEMLNAESGHVKLEAVKAVCARVRLGIRCGDCMCSYKK